MEQADSFRCPAAQREHQGLRFRERERERFSKTCLFFLGFLVVVAEFTSQSFRKPFRVVARSMRSLSFTRNARALPNGQRTTSCHVESPRRPQMRLLRPRRRRRRSSRRNAEQRQESLLRRRAIVVPLLRLCGGSPEPCSPRPAPRGTGEVPRRPRGDA